MMLSGILLSVLMILLSILSLISHLTRGNNLNWLLNLNLIYGTLEWSKKWLVDFNTQKTQLVLFDQSNNTGSIDMKLGGSVLGEKSSFKMQGLTFSSKLDWGSYMISIAKTASKKIGALIGSIKFFLLRLLCISINVPYAHVQSTVVTSGLIPLVATWNCQTSYKNEYAELLVLHLLLLLNPWLIVEMWPA